ncbi:hypothetical protein A6R70_13240 [Agrobacterium rubi]|uniref:recombinase family protein n=1 Tax=Agrobacterium rubi TaxID=28099 RepID=UPI00201B6EC6|nr:recombinase family protein [Agrobacterium rubi]MCL6653252.1 hypothetical protein [Agrobacterium rubi]
MEKYVAYYRVSGRDSARKLLDLDAQRGMIEASVSKHLIIAEFIDVEAGRKQNRGEFARALSFARVNGASLIAATAKGLTRSRSFRNLLLEGDVTIKLADTTDSAVSLVDQAVDEEAEVARERTRNALCQAKKRGLGKENPRYNAVIATNARAELSADRMFKQIVSIRGYEEMSFRGLAAALNNRGYKTPRGNKYVGDTVKRVLERRSAQANGAVIKR